MPNKTLRPEHVEKLAFVYAHDDVWAESFQLFPTDFTGNEQVKMMSPEQVGAYFLLICACFQLKLALPNCPEKLARIVGLTQERFDAISPDVLACFAEHPTKPRCLTHTKLIEVRYAQLQQQLSRRGKRQNNNDTPTDLERNDNETTTEHQRNATPQSSVLSPQSGGPQTSVLSPRLGASEGGEPPSPPPSGDGLALAQKLHESVRINSPNLRSAKLTGAALDRQLAKWARVIDVGLRRDGYSVEQWRGLLAWVRDDNRRPGKFRGWGKVVLSAEKLRQESLWSQYLERSGGGGDDDMYPESVEELRRQGVV